MHMPEDDVGVARAHNRYRALLDVSVALVEQPTVKAVLHSLREVLSSSVRLHGADLYLLDSGRETLDLLEFDRAVDAPAIRVGTKIQLARQARFELTTLRFTVAAHGFRTECYC